MQIKNGVVHLNTNSINKEHQYCYYGHHAAIIITELIIYYV